MHNRCIVLAKKNANFLKQAHYILLHSLLHKKATWLITYYLLILCILGLLWKIVFGSKVWSVIRTEKRIESQIFRLAMLHVNNDACSSQSIPVPITYLVLHLQNWQFVSRQVFLWGVLLLLFWEATNIFLFFQVLTLLKYNEIEKKNSISSCWSHRRWMHSCWKLIKFSL